MSKVAGYNYIMTFDSGGGHVTLGAVNLDLQMPFDTADVTETGQAGQDMIVTVQRATVTGSGVTENTGDDTAKDSFETAANAGTQCEIIVYPTGNASTKRKYTFDAYITSYSVTNNGPAGAVGFSFTLGLTGGSKVAIGAVS